MTPEAKAFAHRFAEAQLKAKGIIVPANATTKFITTQPHPHVIRAIKLQWGFRKQYLVTTNTGDQNENP